MIHDADRLATTPARATALACIEAGIEASHPRRVIRESVGIDRDTLIVDGARYDLSDIDRLFLVGGGKASGPAVAELEQVLGERLTRGAIVVPEAVETSLVTVDIGDHPVPSERSVTGARHVLELAESAGDSTLILAVISGGGSSLLTAPADGVELVDIQATTEGLIRSGATIDELNAVRKHLSAIKGGGLARAASPARVVGLVFSDVVDDDLGVIASGPTAPDDSSFQTARTVLDRYDIDPPAAVRTRLQHGADGEIPETVPPGDPVFARVSNHVIASGFTALGAANEVAISRGYDSCMLSSRIRGEAREAAKTMVAIGEEVLATGHPLATPAVVVSGGECTVTVSGEGQGGPNLEFALSSALELSADSIAIASVDTDGLDGTSDAAGAVVDGTTVTDRAAAHRALATNDTHPYLDERRALISTGITNTNVNDLRVLVVED